jgi:hypothetical protein
MFFLCHIEHYIFRCSILHSYIKANQSNEIVAINKDFYKHGELIAEMNHEIAWEQFLSFCHKTNILTGR